MERKLLGATRTMAGEAVCLEKEEILRAWCIGWREDYKMQLQKTIRVSVGIDREQN